MVINCGQDLKEKKRSYRIDPRQSYKIVQDPTQNHMEPLSILDKMLWDLRQVWSSQQLVLKYLTDYTIKNLKNYLRSIQLLFLNRLNAKTRLAQDPLESCKILQDSRQSYKIVQDPRQNPLESLCIRNKMLRDLRQDSEGLNSILWSIKKDNNIKI